MKTRILIVLREPKDINDLAKYLHSFAPTADFDGTTDVKDALDKFQAARRALEPYDLVVTEFDLGPMRNGGDLISAMTGTTLGIEVVLFTKKTLEELAMITSDDRLKRLNRCYINRADPDKLAARLMAIASR